MAELEHDSGQPVLELRTVTRRFDDRAAVDRISFAVRPGEFFSLLGPSGCGKTTTLRLIAGFERPDEGEIRLQGRRADRLKPYERPVGMVFQSYALFPHLSVGRNVAFGLERRKVPRDRAGRLVREALERVRLPGYESRDPAALSGGQRQRVALARALVVDPPILLLDEPLGALDLRLRQEMQLELKALQKELGTTFVYVTHDQEEALTMSDRIAVMSEGRIEQIGSPDEIYERPRSRFVADFIGSTNFIEGVVRDRRNDAVEIESPDWGRVRVTPNGSGDGKIRDRVAIAIRPERLRLLPAHDAGDGPNRAAGTVRDRIYVGDHLRYPVALPSGREVVVAAPRTGGGGARTSDWSPGDRVIVAWDPADGVLLDDA